MSALSRRAALVAPAAFAALPAAAAPGGHPDADLLALCARHAANIAAVNAVPHEAWSDDAPAYLAYRSTLDALNDAAPRTMPGIVALVWVAKAEAEGADGARDYAHTAAGNWLGKAGDALLRLAQDGHA